MGGGNLEIKETSVILPVKNEPYLNHLLNHICRNGEYCEIRIQTEQGLSNAVLKGISLAKGNVIAVMDSDGSHSPKYLNSMIAMIGDYDIVLGSRYIQGGSSQDSLGRKIISLIYQHLAKLMFNLPIKDVMSGYIVAKKEVYDSLKLNPLGFKFGLELLIKAKGKYRVCEYPVHFSKRKLGSSKADFKQGIQTLWFMLQLFIKAR